MLVDMDARVAYCWTTYLTLAFARFLSFSLRLVLRYTLLSASYINWPIWIAVRTKYAVVEPNLLRVNPDQLSRHYMGPGKTR